MRLALPGPRIGRLDLQLRYTVPHEKLARPPRRRSPCRWSCRGMGKLGHNQLRVLPQAGILATVRKGPWTTEANSAANPAGLQVDRAPSRERIAAGDRAQAAAFRREDRGRMRLDPNRAGRGHRVRTGCSIVSAAANANCGWRSRPGRPRRKFCWMETRSRSSRKRGGEFVVPLAAGDGERSTSWSRAIRFLGVRPRAGCRPIRQRSGRHRGCAACIGN